MGEITESSYLHFLFEDFTFFTFFSDDEKEREREPSTNLRFRLALVSQVRAFKVGRSAIEICLQSNFSELREVGATR